MKSKVHFDISKIDKLQYLCINVINTKVIVIQASESLMMAYIKEQRGIKKKKGGRISTYKLKPVHFGRTRRTWLS